jgi:hypothetical protein
MKENLIMKRDRFPPDIFIDNALERPLRARSLSSFTMRIRRLAPHATAAQRSFSDLTPLATRGEKSDRGVGQSHRLLSYRPVEFHFSGAEGFLFQLERYPLQSTVPFHLQHDCPVRLDGMQCGA